MGFFSFDELGGVCWQYISDEAGYGSYATS